MVRIPLWIGSFIGVLLGCAGAGTEGEIDHPPEEPHVAPAPANWIDEAVTDALDAEVMPGTDGEPEPGRQAEVRTFFETHSEYADPKRLALLLEEACLGVERSHEQLLTPPPKEPLIVEVTAAQWKVVVAHADSACTSDDWSWFTNEVSEALKKEGIVYAYAGPSHSEVVIRKPSLEKLQNQPLDGQGYLALSPDRPPEEIGHDMVDTVLERLHRYFEAAKTR